MSQLITGAAKRVAGNKVQEFAKAFEPEDPYYEFYEQNGKQKRRKVSAIIDMQRAIPPGLTRKEAKILMKIKRRAHYLDKGFRICGFRFGWTALISLIPFAGDVADALLNHYLVVKKAQQIDE